MLCGATSQDLLTAQPHSDSPQGAARCLVRGSGSVRGGGEEEKGEDEIVLQYEEKERDTRKKVQSGLEA